MAYTAEVQTDFDSGLLEIFDAIIYAAKVKKDPDMPNFHVAILGLMQSSIKKQCRLRLQA